MGLIFGFFALMAMIVLFLFMTSTAENDIWKEREKNEKM